MREVLPLPAFKVAADGAAHGRSFFLFRRRQSFFSYFGQELALGVMGSGEGGGLVVGTANWAGESGQSEGSERKGNFASQVDELAPNTSGTPVDGVGETVMTVRVQYCCSQCKYFKDALCIKVQSFSLMGGCALVVEA